MKLNNQKRIASKLLKVGKKKVKFDTERLSDIKESITKADLRSLIGQGAIKVSGKNSQSKSRARKNAEQKRKGRRKGHGSRKGKSTARLPSKRTWINKVRLQRTLVKTLKDKDLITSQTYRLLRNKIKGGFFRSKKHLSLYLKDNKLVKE